MSSILGALGITVPRETDDLPPDAPRGREAERVLAAELLQEFRRLTQVTTEYAERITHGVINHVLEVATWTIPDTGYFTRTYAVTAGSIELRNLATHDMTVVSSVPGSAAPAGGIGVYVVAPGCSALVNLASHDVTIWGTAGDKFSYQVFSAGGRAVPSLNAVDGGGA